MNQEKVQVNDSEIVFYEASGEVRWRRGLPRFSEWNLYNSKWAPEATQDGFVKGAYMYCDFTNNRQQVVVCFYPYGGLARNFWFDCKDGKLIEITESR